MIKVTKEILKECAERIMFDMSDEQYQMLLDEFDIVIEQMELIGDSKDIESLEPMTFPFLSSTDYLREDIAETPLTQEEVLKNAKEVQEGQIKLPKVVN